MCHHSHQLPSITMQKTYISVIGDNYTGKSNIIERCVFNEFKIKYYKTICINPTTFKYNYHDEIIKCMFCDIPGDTMYLQQNIAWYCKNNRVIILLVYDVCSRISFKNLDIWLEAIMNNNNKPHIILVGNKIDDDINRQVSYDEGKMYALLHNMEFIECSAKNNINLDILLNKIAELYITINKKFPLHDHGITCECSKKKKKICMIQ